MFAVKNPGPFSPCGKMIWHWFPNTLLLKTVDELELTDQHVSTTLDN